MKCPPSKNVLFDLVPRELPHVIIICLGDETYETVTVFDILKECSKLGGITLIVVANESDRVTFMNHTALERMYFLDRPVSLFALYEKINEIEKELEERRGACSYR